MDEVVEKFGIYDLMGIWGPGAITVTYFYFTMNSNIIMIFRSLNIILPNISEQYKLIILYTAVAYVTGIILHETGRLITEHLKCFRTQKIKKLAYNGEISRGIGYRIKNQYKKIIEETIHDEIEYREMKFDEAISYLKYVSQTGTTQIDKYHSIYALARSLSICFMSHAAIYSIGTIIANNAGKITCIVVIFDLIMLFLFWERSYRYFCMWVRNVFIQYYLVKLKCDAC